MSSSLPQQLRRLNPNTTAWWWVEWLLGNLVKQRYGTFKDFVGLGRKSFFTRLESVETLNPPMPSEFSRIKYVNMVNESSRVYTAKSPIPSAHPSEGTPINIQQPTRYAFGNQYHVSQTRKP